MRSTGLPLDGLGAPWMMPQDEQALLAYSSDGRLPYEVDWAPT